MRQTPDVTMKDLWQFAAGAALFPSCEGHAKTPASPESPSGEHFPRGASMAEVGKSC
jgi:hypothetical protein